MWLTDKLSNLVANLGTSRDKASHNAYFFEPLSPAECMAAYRGSWLPRKIVDIPAKDATRRWRAWQADKAQVQAIEGEEKRLGLQGKVKTALISARLRGGAAIYIGTNDANVSLPLDPARIAKGGITYLTVLSRTKLTAGEIDQDPLNASYGKPLYYTMGANAVTVHPSRLVIFPGATIPDDDLSLGIDQGWGDSVLNSILQEIKNADATMANMASLVFEAKIDVIQVPDLMDNIGDRQYETKLLERFRLAAMLKGNNGMLVLDAEEEYSSKTTAFGNLPEISDRFLQVVSGAADIPATRLLGQAPAGLNATGDSDLRNYYDRIQSEQELEVSPAMAVLDECLIRSALGARDPSIYYTWNSLWQTTSTERIANGLVVAQTLTALVGTRLFNPEALSAAAANVLVENEVLPGLEAAIEEFGEFDPDAEDTTDPVTDPVTGKTTTDAEPKTLYVSRDVLNASEILSWAKGQGFPSTLAASDLHVTIAFSRTPIDWMKVGSPWSDDSKGNLTVVPGGARMMEQFGDATVLLFNSSALSWRHEDIQSLGASWDHPEYQPHITISYDAKGMDLSKVVPYRGQIELGPEIFAEVDDDWKNSVQE